jgi:hypothetical protein
MIFISNYEYKVMVTMKDGGIKIIAEGEIKKHMRSDGWRKLMQRVIDESKDIG